MNYKIIILNEAKTDFRESYIWYKEISPKLAKRFQNSFKKSVSVLSINPLHFQIRYDDVRVIMLTAFPYLIHYSINNDKIIIKAIYHSSRNSELGIF
ncbi:type II toxin-antitoxin system RelE/ParE family toxin [Flavobacterium oreochromis]|uniref:type II toxin-antitoxin system RelE/ParE family toxin n=1 Tax=Flavobacterium oreochromis TaxID=2906078 RepID=UPI00385F2543